MRQSLLPLLVLVLTASCQVEEEPPRTLVDKDSAAPKEDSSAGREQKTGDEEDYGLHFINSGRTGLREYFERMGAEGCEGLCGWAVFILCLNTGREGGDHEGDTHNGATHCVYSKALADGHSTRRSCDGAIARSGISRSIRTLLLLPAPPHHWHLWINLAAAGDQDTVRSPRNDFQRCGDLRRTPATRGAVRGELCGSSLLVDAGPSPLVVLLNEGLLRDVKGSAPKPAPLAVRQLPERCDCVFCPEVLTESRIAQEP